MSTPTVDFDARSLADAYVYLLGRALVIRQENIDLAEPGVEYNKIKYNPVGSADFVNPNLDVAYMEAWIAVDDRTVVLLEVPEITGRYYTAQFLNEWGEVITNINERTFPFHASGKFALVTPGSTVAIPEGAARVELHSNKAKMLARVELQSDIEGAVRLQQQFKLSTIGQPEIRLAAAIPAFDNRTLMGVEIFENIDLLLADALDTSPIAAEMQAKARAVAAMTATAEGRATLNSIIREKIVPEYLTFVVTKAGVYQNSWLAPLLLGNYGKEFWVRTGANLIGIWANSTDEVIYFVATRDADGEVLNGSNDYEIDFSSTGNPDSVVNGYWSVILVDVPNYRVVPNRLNRFNVNSYSPLQTESDGSLKLLVSKESTTAIPEPNWLPAPDGRTFSLTFRTYVPKDVIKKGEWFPPALKRIG